MRAIGMGGVGGGRASMGEGERAPLTTLMMMMKGSDGRGGEIILDLGLGRGPGRNHLARHPIRAGDIAGESENHIRRRSAQKEERVVVVVGKPLREIGRHRIARVGRRETTNTTVSDDGRLRGGDRTGRVARRTTTTPTTITIPTTKAETRRRRRSEKSRTDTVAIGGAHIPASDIARRKRVPGSCTHRIH